MDKATSNHAFCSTDTPTSVSLSCFSWFSWLNNLPASSCPLVSIRGSYSFRHFVPFVYFVLFVVHPLLNGRVAELPRGRAHARHPRTAFSSLFPMKNYSCPLVSIRGSYSFRHFVPFVYFVLFVVKYSLRPFVSIRVHSCSFVVHIFPPLRGSYSLHPFVSIRGLEGPQRHQKQTGHPRKIIKKVYISSCYSKTSFPYGTSWSP